MTLSSTAVLVWATAMLAYPRAVIRMSFALPAWVGDALDVAEAFELERARNTVDRSTDQLLMIVL